MNKFISYTSSILILAAAASCQKHETVHGTGTIYLSLENSPVVEVVTRASEVDTDDFRVNVVSSANQYSYFYKDMAGGKVVPSGTYTVSAENVSADVSLTQPNAWGQPRYFGISEAKQVGGTAETTQFNITCTMVNAALSVIFDETITRNFTDYRVSASTDEGRTLEYNASNTTGEAPAVGYFTPKALRYKFTGNYKDYSKPTEDAEYTLTPVTVSGAKDLAKATHLNLTFKTSSENGSIGINITVDTTYENLYETVIVNPDSAQ